MNKDSNDATTSSSSASTKTVLVRNEKLGRDSYSDNGNEGNDDRIIIATNTTNNNNKTKPEAVRRRHLHR